MFFIVIFFLLYREGIDFRRRQRVVCRDENWAGILPARCLQRCDTLAVDIIRGHLRNYVDNNIYTPMELVDSENPSCPSSLKAMKCGQRQFSRYGVEVPVLGTGAQGLREKL